MRSKMILGILAALALTACEKDFDREYEENLDELNKQAADIKSSVDKKLAEGAQADRIMNAQAEENPLTDTAEER